MTPVLESTVIFLIFRFSHSRACPAGGDIFQSVHRYLARYLQADSQKSQTEAYPGTWLLSELEVWKPLSGAINGSLLGGGLEIVLTSDIRIASDTASLGLYHPWKH